MTRHGRALCGVLWSSSFPENFFWLSCRARNLAGAHDPLDVILDEQPIRDWTEEVEVSTPLQLQAKDLAVAWTTKVCAWHSTMIFVLWLTAF